MIGIDALRSTLATILPQHRGTLITQRHGNYRLDIDALGPIDAFVFSDAIDAARTRLRENNPDAAIRFLEQALPLYRGELFADAEDIAFEPHRQYFRLRYREGLRMLVDLYLHEGRTETALEALFEARERADVESDLQEKMTAITGDIVTHWIAHAQKRPTIAFCVNVAHAREVAQEFERGGIAAGVGLGLLNNKVSAGGGRRTARWPFIAAARSGRTARVRHG